MIITKEKAESLYCPIIKSCVKCITDRCMSWEPCQIELPQEAGMLDGECLFATGGRCIMLKK